MLKNDMPGEHSLFTIRGSLKKRIVTTAIFAFFMLMIFAGIYLRNIYIFVMGISASLMSFWPFTDAYERIEVTNLRIKRSEFSKKTAKTMDIPLDSLAFCTETEDGSKIELLFLLDDPAASQSVQILMFDKNDENATLLMQLPCPKRKELGKRINGRFV